MGIKRQRLAFPSGKLSAGESAGKLKQVERTIRKDFRHGYKAPRQLRFRFNADVISAQILKAAKNIKPVPASELIAKDASPEDYIKVMVSNADKFYHINDVVSEMFPKEIRPLSAAQKMLVRNVEYIKVNVGKANYFYLAKPESERAAEAVKTIRTLFDEITALIGEGRLNKDLVPESLIPRVVYVVKPLQKSLFEMRTPLLTSEENNHLKLANSFLRRGWPINQSR